MTDSEEEKSVGATSLVPWFPGTDEEFDRLEFALLNLSASLENLDWKVMVKQSIVDQFIENKFHLGGAKNSNWNRNKNQAKDWSGESMYSVYNLCDNPATCFLRSTYIEQVKKEKSNPNKDDKIPKLRASSVIQTDLLGEQLIKEYKKHVDRIEMKISGKTFSCGDYKISIGKCAKGHLKAPFLVVQVTYEPCKGAQEGAIINEEFLRMLGHDEELLREGKPNLPIEYNYELAGLTERYTHRHTALQYINLYDNFQNLR